MKIGQKYETIFTRTPLIFQVLGAFAEVQGNCIFMEVVMHVTSQESQLSWNTGMSSVQLGDRWGFVLVIFLIPFWLATWYCFDPFYCRTPVTSHKRAAIFAQFLRVSHVHGVVIWTRQGDGEVARGRSFLDETCPNSNLSKSKQLISQEKISNFTCTFKRVCQGGLGSAWFHFPLAAQEADTETECSSASAFGDLAALAIGQTNIDKFDTSLYTVMKIHQCYYLACGIVEYIMYCIPDTSSWTGTYIILYIIYITISINI